MGRSQDINLSNRSRLPKPAEIFFSYSHRDEALRDELARHLSTLRLQGLVTQWHDRRIAPGQEWQDAIDAHLEKADIILLLISSDFIASEYCYGIEMNQAMARHEAGIARVVPVVLRPTDWQGTPFSKLQALPKNAKPVTTWSNLDEAFFNVATGLRRVIEDFRKHQESSSSAPVSAAQRRGQENAPPEPREEEASRVQRETLQDQGSKAAKPAPAKPELALVRSRQLTEHKRPVNVVAFSPDGAMLASGSEAGFFAQSSVRLWNVSDGKQQRVLDESKFSLHSLAFSPDGEILFSASVNNVWLWRVSDGARLPDLEGLHSEKIALSADGSILASIPYPSGDLTVELRHIPGGEQIGTLTPPSSVKYAFACLAFSSDGTKLATSGMRTAYLWSVPEGEVLRTFKVPEQEAGIISLAFSPDGTILAAGTNNLWLWSTSDSQLECRIEHAKIRTSVGFINSIAFSPDGIFLVSGADDWSVRLWRISDGKLLHVLEGHRKNVNSVAFSPDGTTLASASNDKTVRLWDLKMIAQ